MAKPENQFEKLIGDLENQSNVISKLEKKKGRSALDNLLMGSLLFASIVLGYGYRSSIRRVVFGNDPSAKLVVIPNSGNPVQMTAPQNQLPKAPEPSLNTAGNDNVESVPSTNNNSNIDTQSFNWLNNDLTLALSRTGNGCQDDASTFFRSYHIELNGFAVDVKHPISEGVFLHQDPTNGSCYASQYISANNPKIGLIYEELWKWAALCEPGSPVFEQCENQVGEFGPKRDEFGVLHIEKQISPTIFNGKSVEDPSGEGVLQKARLYEYLAKYGLNMVFWADNPSVKFNDSILPSSMLVNSFQSMAVENPSDPYSSIGSGNAGSMWLGAPYPILRERILRSKNTVHEATTGYVTNPNGEVIALNMYLFNPNSPIFADNGDKKCTDGGPSTSAEALKVYQGLTPAEALRQSGYTLQFDESFVNQFNSDPRNNPWITVGSDGKISSVHPEFGEPRILVSQSARRNC